MPCFHYKTWNSFCTQNFAVQIRTLMMGFQLMALKWMIEESVMAHMTLCLSLALYLLCGLSMCMLYCIMTKSHPLTLIFQLKNLQCFPCVIYDGLCLITSTHCTRLMQDRLWCTFLLMYFAIRIVWLSIYFRQQINVICEIGM